MSIKNVQQKVGAEENKEVHKNQKAGVDYYYDEDDEDEDEE